MHKKFWGSDANFGKIPNGCCGALLYAAGPLVPLPMPTSIFRAASLLSVSLPGLCQVSVSFRSL